MPGPEEKEILIQLAELRQQMNAVTSSMDEIKASVKEVGAVHRQVGELAVYLEQQRKDSGFQWERIDANRVAIEQVAKKSDEWINKGRGALSMLLILGSLAQAAVLSFVAYTFVHLRTAEDALLLLNHRVLHLEKLQTKGQP